jgi:hypothetical protein
MIELCESCTLRQCTITEPQLVAGWERLILDDKTREKLLSDEFSVYDAAEARTSSDPTVRKIATGRALAFCLMRNCYSDTCPRSAVYRYAHVDDAGLLA